MENVNIHKTAIVHPGAQLSPGVTVDPYSVIGEHVKLGDNVRVGSHVVITGQTTIGQNCKIYTGAVIGSHPQDLKHKAGDNVFLNIGENNTFREYITVNSGTVEGGAKTVIGNHNLFMAYSHVAHDCIIGNNCVLANAGTLAGHVTLEDNAIIGGLSAVHQFCRIGRLAIIGGLTRITQDVPPFSMCVGNPARVMTTNVVGLERAKVNEKTCKALAKAFKILFKSGLARPNAVKKIEEEIESCPEIDHLLFFVKTSERGVLRG